MIDPFYIAASAVGVIAPAVTKLFPMLRDYLLAPQNQRILRRVVWVTCIVMLLAISAASIYGLGWMIGSYQPGIALSVILWSLFLGTTASLLLPSKAIVATFGGLVGVSLSEVGTAAGLVSVLRKQITALAIELGNIANPGGPGPMTPDPFVTWMIWLFIGIAALLCLPAFFEKDRDNVPTGT
ncbi:MAG: hypothetical protein ACLP5H_25545 [Desulfomonilaceae bacterium]